MVSWRCAACLWPTVSAGSSSSLSIVLQWRNIRPAARYAGRRSQGHPGKTQCRFERAQLKDPHKYLQNLGLSCKIHMCHGGTVTVVDSFVFVIRRKAGDEYFLYTTYPYGNNSRTYSLRLIFPTNSVIETFRSVWRLHAERKIVHAQNISTYTAPALSLNKYLSMRLLSE